MAFYGLRGPIVGRALNRYGPSSFRNRAFTSFFLECKTYKASLLFNPFESKYHTLEREQFSNPSNSEIKKVLWRRHVGMYRKDKKEGRNNFKVFRCVWGYNKLDKMSGCRHWMKFWYNEVLWGLLALRNVAKFLKFQWATKSNKLVSRQGNF